MEAIGTLVDRPPDQVESIEEQQALQGYSDLVQSYAEPDGQGLQLGARRVIDEPV
ncbi:MAG: hypothetical protein WKF83_06215 [Nocardioidaceae bacterium]